MITSLTTMDLRPIAGHIGAEVTGLDLRQPLASDTVMAVRTALNKHKVLVFRDQALNHAAHVALGRTFGDLTPADPHNPPAISGFPEILIVDPQPDIDRYGADFEVRFRDRRRSYHSAWHVDNMPTPNPPEASILRAERVPDGAGDTHWTNLVAAYEGLSGPLRELANGLRVEHRYLAGYQMLDHDPEVTAVLDTMVHSTPIITVHPLVRAVPSTGERALFHSPATAARIIGVSSAESRALLDMLDAQITRDEYRCRVRWTPDTVVMWDNQTTAHLAALDHAHINQPRRLYRVTLLGQTPIGVDGQPSEPVTGAPLQLAAHRHG